MGDCERFNDRKDIQNRYKRETLQFDVGIQSAFDISQRLNIFLLQSFLQLFIQLVFRQITVLQIKSNQSEIDQLPSLGTT